MTNEGLAAPVSARDEAFAEFALRTAIDAGAAILPHFRAPIDVEDKGGDRGYDQVTEADRAAEAVISAAIASRYPDHGVEGEEHGRREGRSAFTWVVDPIDGTRPIVGVTHQPFVGESFVAVGGRSEWRRGAERRSLATRVCPRLEAASVTTTDPRLFKSARERAAYGAVTEGTRLVRYGGDCYCYTRLAMGLVDIVIETGLHAYDIQALIPLIENAGGVVTNWEGGSCDRGGDVLACGDRALHAELLGRIAARR